MSYPVRCEPTFRHRWSGQGPYQPDGAAMCLNCGLLVERATGRCVGRNWAMLNGSVNRQPRGAELWYGPDDPDYQRTHPHQFQKPATLGAPARRPAPVQHSRPEDRRTACVPGPP